MEETDTAPHRKTDLNQFLRETEKWAADRDLSLAYISQQAGCTPRAFANMKSKNKRILEDMRKFRRFMRKRERQERLGPASRLRKTKKTKPRNNKTSQ